MSSRPHGSAGCQEAKAVLRGRGENLRRCVKKGLLGSFEANPNRVPSKHIQVQMCSVGDVLCCQDASVKHPDIDKLIQVECSWVGEIVRSIPDESTLQIQRAYYQFPLHKKGLIRHNSSFPQPKNDSLGQKKRRWDPPTKKERQPKKKKNKTAISPILHITPWVPIRPVRPWQRCDPGGTRREIGVRKG